MGVHAIGDGEAASVSEAGEKTEVTDEKLVASL